MRIKLSLRYLLLWMVAASTASAVTAPAALSGTATGTGSIQWTWTAVAGATYNIYPSNTSTPIYIGISTTTFSETGLSANRPYSRNVTAVIASSESTLSPSATVYTMADAPGVPTFSFITSTSAVVNWTTVTNPAYTPYAVYRTTDVAFVNGVVQVAAFTSNLTVPTTAVSGLNPATTYYFKVLAQNGDALFISTSPAGQLFTSVPSGVGSFGPGTASVVPSTAAPGGIVTTTITYTAPAGGMTVGGSVEINLPASWASALQTGCPTCNGYVVVSSTAGASLGISLSAAAAEVRVLNGFVSSGVQIIVGFQNLSVGCPLPNQTGALWRVRSALSSAFAKQDLATQPSQNYTAGTAQWIGYTFPNPLTVAAGQPSAALVFQANDFCGQPAVLTSSVTINLTGLTQDTASHIYSTDSGASFSATQGFGTTVNSVLMPALSTSATFYYKTTTVGNNLWIRGDYSGLPSGSAQQIWRPVTSLSALPSLGALSLDNGAAVSGQTLLTLTPDGSGAGSFVYIRFNPSDVTLNWHVTISSNNFATVVYERFGVGPPGSTLFWDGRDMSHGGQIAANGTYVVKIEFVGLTVVDTSLVVVLNSAQITGTVQVGGAPVAGAFINAQGSNTPGYSFATTDANGFYVLNGLRSGFQYNLYANYVSAVNSSALVSGFLNNVAAPAVNQNFILSTPAFLRVSATSVNQAAQTTFGYLNIHSTDYSKNYFGNVRLLAGSSVSDNGDSFNPSSWTVIAVQPGTYVLHLSMNGYGTTDPTVTVASGQTQDVSMPLVSRATIYGIITLPAPAANATWISVEGTKQGNNFPTAWGGVSFNAGQSSGVYSIFAVEAGVYTFRARPPGYVPSTHALTTVGSTDVGDSVSGGVDFSGFSTGGQITGTITVNGDTSSLAILNLFVNAYSPVNGDNESTQVSIATNTSTASVSYAIQGVGNGVYTIYPPYLPGFQSPTNGPLSVTVVNNAATLDMTLTQNSGVLSGNVSLPGNASDYGNVHLSVQGPTPAELTLAGGSFSIPHLGTGFYNVTATYSTTGARVQLPVSLTNGQTLPLSIDLTPPTRSISGAVSILNGFSIRGSSGTSVAINTITDLLANATNQALYFSQTQNSGGGFDCSQTAPTIVSTARVEAFPKSFNSFNASNRAGFANCFAPGSYKFGVIDSSGNYVIPGLSPGLWELNVYPYFDNGQAPNVATSKKIITVNAGDVPGINFPLSNGYSVSGTISLSTGVTDTRTFNVQILSDRGDSVQTTQVDLGLPNAPAGSATYLFSNLPSGNYSLFIQDFPTFDVNLNQSVVKYVAKPVQFTIASADQTGVDVTMGRAASVIGKMGVAGANADKTANLTLITPSNISLLPNNFRIFANADPWIPGGFGQAQSDSSGKVAIDANNQFRINGLVPGTYNISFRQDSSGLSVQGSGSLNLATYTAGSVVVGEGQTIDLGTISLKAGLLLSGTVKDQSGNGLSNIRVRAQATSDKHGQDNIEAFSDAAGNFTLIGLNPDFRVYNIVAAPRPGSNDTVLPVPYGPVQKLAVDATVVPAPVLNFVLPPATAALTGTVLTIDGGSLSYPDGGEQTGFPAAAVFLHLQGTVSEDNPLGDDNATDLGGHFNISNLVSGIYDITIESLGYRPLKLNGVVLANGSSKDLGTLTLQKGPEIHATLAKADGTSVNTKDVRTAVAVTSDLTSIIFGQVNSDANTNNITSINFAGFELSPKVYNVLLFDNQDNITAPPEGHGIVFISSSDVISKALTFQQSAPFAFVHAIKTGNVISLTYYLSRPLRNRGDDQDITAWFTLTQGQGVLSGQALSGDRRQLTVIYTPAAGEQNATVRFSAHTVDIDPATGTEFVINKTITLLLGQKATVESNVNPALGGSVSLASSNDPSNVTIPGNALLTSTGAPADAGNSYAFTLTATDDSGSIPAASHAIRSAAIGDLMAKGAGAYVSEAYAAMGVARVSSAINPLSSFYSVLLPAGLSHTLSQSATLTLSYSSGADPNSINIYYFDGTKYLIEKTNRQIDPVNRTISVGVSHFSTFVVLENASPVILVSGGSTSAAEISVMNFPNPFDLKAKTKTLNHGGTTSELSTDGTIIRYNIPAAKAGHASITIYDVVGEKVRVIELGVPAADTYQYVSWDGKNNHGSKVASGIYIGVLKVGSEKRFWKMAVLK